MLNLAGNGGLVGHVGGGKALCLLVSGYVLGISLDRNASRDKESVKCWACVSS